MPQIVQKINSMNEGTWMHIGRVAEIMNDTDKALYAYENCLRHNQFNVKALAQIANIFRNKDQYSKAVEYYRRALNVENTNSEIWGALGHCFLMMDELQQAYNAYHQAIYNAKLQNKTKQDPHLWFGIGILYERYSSFDNAEEAFTSVLKMDPNFEKSNEIYFRLGIIYKQQQKYEQSLECFGHILQSPPTPLTEADIWFQIGHVYELKKDFNEAKKSYERVLKYNPNHAKVLQQLGWLYHQNTQFKDQEVAINYLQRSIDSDSSDGQTWYLLGRCFMAQQKYRSAYDAYQQAVFRDGRNPTFWCSIGVLYYQINQYKDALDAYSRAIRLNPFLSEVWYDLGTLYESCNQLYDALDAYQRAADLDPKNKHIHQRLNMLRSQVASKTQPHMSEKSADVKGPLAPINTVEPSPNNRFAQTPPPPPPMSIQPKSAAMGSSAFNEPVRQHQGPGSSSMGAMAMGPGSGLPPLSSNAPNPNAALSAMGNTHASPMHQYPRNEQMRPEIIRSDSLRAETMRSDQRGVPPSMARTNNISPFGNNSMYGAPGAYASQSTSQPIPSQHPPHNYGYASSSSMHHEQIPPMEALDKTPLQERDNLKRSNAIVGGHNSQQEQDRKRQKLSHYSQEQQVRYQERKRNDDDDDDEDEDEMVIHEEYDDRGGKKMESAARVDEQSRKQEPPSVVVNKEDGNSPKRNVNNVEGAAPTKEE